jgi:hypothetical protein
LKRLKYILPIIFALHFIQCNKGGIFRNIDEKLANNNSHWRLVKYQVNGVDSTDLINFGNYPNFKEKFFLAMKYSKYSGMPNCTNRFFVLAANFTDNDEYFTVSSVTPVKMNNNYGLDSCVSINKQECQRNVFFPEGIKTKWKIKRFSSRKLILTCTQTNEYYLEIRN